MLFTECPPAYCPSQRKEHSPRSAVARHVLVRKMMLAQQVTDTSVLMTTPLSHNRYSSSTTSLGDRQSELDASHTEHTNKTRKIERNCDAQLPHA